MPQSITEAFAQITEKAISESMQVPWENSLPLSVATLH